MIAGIAILLLLNLIGLFKRNEGTGRWSDFAFVFGLIALLAVIKFFPFRTTILDITLLFTLLALWMNRKIFRSIAWSYLPLLVTLALFFTPKSTLYRTFNLQFSIEKEYDYRSYDKYAWFLYQEGKFEEAVEALKTAINLAEMPDLAILQDHLKEVDSRSWSKYRWHENARVH